MAVAARHPGTCGIVPGVASDQAELQEPGRGQQSMDDRLGPKRTGSTRRQFGRELAGHGRGDVRGPGDPSGPEPQREAQHRHASASAAGAAPTSRGSRPRTSSRSATSTSRPSTGPRAKHPKARKFRDFRKLYDHANEFDAVVVSTTEHTHAFATLPALQLGKHVYCEKPLTHNVWEARVIREAAAKAKVATQMGTQIHAERQLPPRRRADPGRRDRPGDARSTSGSARAWGRQSAEDAAEERATSSRSRERPDGGRRRSPPGSTGTSGSAPRRRGRSTTSTCPGRSGTAGGTSATAR